MAERLVMTAPQVVNPERAFEFQENLDREMGEGCQDLIIDLSGTTYLSSAGHRVLAGLHERITNDGGSLTLVISETGSVRRIMNLTGALMLYQYFHEVKFK